MKNMALLHAYYYFLVFLFGVYNSYELYGECDLGEKTQKTERRVERETKTGSQNR